MIHQQKPSSGHLKMLPLVAPGQPRLPLSLLLSQLLLVAAAATQSGWHLGLHKAPFASDQLWPLQDLERESSSTTTQGGGGGQLSASQLVNRLRDRQHYETLGARPQFQANADLFECVEPKRTHYEHFLASYNRSLAAADASERLDRLNLYAASLRRAILFNRVVQNEVLNATNYLAKAQIGDYHFVEPSGSGQASWPRQTGGGGRPAQHTLGLWYADVTDCELGLIKYVLFDIFYLLDRNEFEIAYRKAQEHSEYLPLLDEDGFEQLANILLVRLFDRFRGDDKMHQLFQWPRYLKKLAAYAFSRREFERPDFKSRLALVSFAYPAYFKDLKYNWPAINRTGDNVRANQEHVRFISFHRREFANLAERNKRLAVFRQRWSLVNQLNQDAGNLAGGNEILSLQPEWVRLQQQQQQPAADELRTSDRLIETPLEQRQAAAAARPFNVTQFSDLTDIEFVAYLNNDFALLDGNKESISYIERHFPARALDGEFLDELALELELRRASLANSHPELSHAGQSPSARLQAHQRLAAPNQARPGLQLARQVLDELVSDVGLPVGPVSLVHLKEDEHFSQFQRLGIAFRKSYAAAPTWTTSELTDERQRRYDQFKQNHGRFRAWFVKEGWHEPGRQSVLDEQQQLAMLRLADLSWLEVKITLFKLCCLSTSQLDELARTNATIEYLASNRDVMCRPLSAGAQPASSAPGGSGGGGGAANLSPRPEDEMAALELYFLYSVHFNKHHSNMAEFERKFAIFRRNVDSLRRHSCTRSLTLQESLRTRRVDTMNSMDVLDARRSFTDDLNLDRYDYFRLPNPRRYGQESGGFVDDYWASSARYSADLIPAPPRNAAQRQPDEGPTSSRVGGVTYRRQPFASLWGAREPLEPSRREQLPSRQRPSERLLLGDDFDQLAGDQHTRELTRKYAQSGAHKVYELVGQRYRYCMKTVRNIDIEPAEFRQQCQSNGKYADMVTASQLDPPLLTGPGGPSASARLRQNDQCEFYRQGLEPWAEGLIRQDSLSPALIRAAAC